MKDRKEEVTYISRQNDWNECLILMKQNDDYTAYQMKKTILLEQYPAEIRLFIQAIPEIHFFSVKMELWCKNLDLYAYKSMAMNKRYEVLRLYDEWKTKLFEGIPSHIEHKWLEWNEFFIYHPGLQYSLDMMQYHHEQTVYIQDKSYIIKLFLQLLPEVNYFAFHAYIWDDIGNFSKKIIPGKNREEVVMQYKIYHQKLMSMLNNVSDVILDIFSLSYFFSAIMTQD